MVYYGNLGMWWHFGLQREMMFKTYVARYLKFRKIEEFFLSTSTKQFPVSTTVEDEAIMFGKLIN